MSEESKDGKTETPTDGLTPVWRRKAGLVDYWRVKGWPDLCHPVGVDDFACN